MVRCLAGSAWRMTEALVVEVMKAGEAPEVAIEATYGWYRAVDALQAGGANVHLVAPSKVGAFDGRRVNNDQRDCQLLGDLLQANMLPEAWISTPQVREWRELVRYRAKLVGLRSGLKAQAHAVLAKLGVHVPMTDLFGVGGRRLLAHLCADDVRFHSAFGQRIESIVALIEAFDREIGELSASIAHGFRDHAGYHAIQAIDGIGPVTACALLWSARCPLCAHPLCPAWRRATAVLAARWLGGARLCAMAFPARRWCLCGVGAGSTGRPA